MRIAYILQTFPTLSETFVLNELIELDRRGWGIDIFSISLPRDSSMHTEAEAFVPKTHYSLKISALDKIKANIYYSIRHPIRYISAAAIIYSAKPTHLRFLPEAAAFAKIAEENKTEQLHAHFAGIPGSFALLISKLTKIPYSMTAHANEIFVNPNARLMKTQIENSRFTATPSLYNKNYLVKLAGCDSNKIKIIHATIDADKFKEVKISRKKEQILFAARLCEKKGAVYLVEAMKTVIEKYPKIKLLIFGKGPDEQKLRQMSESLKIQKNLIFHGEYTTKEYLKTLQASKIAVLPCIIDKDGDRDVCPLTLQEAMALQIPVISTQLASIPELVENNISGILVPQKDSKALANALLKILGSDKLQIAMGKAGRDKIETEFNIKIQIQKLVDLWTD